MRPHEIRALRLSLGLSQPEFLEMLGIKSARAATARQMVSRWERGERNPSAAAMALIEQLSIAHKRP
jgi:transcriptional regulator with XRE-family HTH domain